MRAGRRFAPGDERRRLRAMKVLVTGTSGRIGRAIRICLDSAHHVVGVDRAPASSTDIVASLHDVDRLSKALHGVDAVVHVAALHAPHVGLLPDAEFESTNVAGTRALARLAQAAGVRRFVFTSTTALYGGAATPAGRAAWIDEDTEPEPRTIYHHTKLAAESWLEAFAHDSGMHVTAVRMSRCFPEPAPLMASYRLHRGIDARDVADAHALAVLRTGAPFARYVVSAQTPFLPTDLEQLAVDAPAVIARRAPELAQAFARRGWVLPPTIDRVYCARRARDELGWQSQHGFMEVLAQFERRSSEVLPPRLHWRADE
jgi:nucleoside-diphosphate-sugar epimerase